MLIVRRQKHNGAAIRRATRRYLRDVGRPASGRSLPRDCTGEVGAARARVGAPGRPSRDMTMRRGTELESASATARFRAGREMTGQPWCGGTFSRSQRSRSASPSEGRSSRSSLVVSGRESPKILLTERRLWRRVRRSQRPSSVTKITLGAWVAVHIAVNTIQRTPAPQTPTRRLPTQSAGSRGSMAADDGKVPRSPGWIAGR